MKQAGFEITTLQGTRGSGTGTLPGEHGSATHGSSGAADLPRDPATGLILPLSRSLASQDLVKHRAMVALELEVIAKKLDRFGWERDRGSAAHDRLILDWMDALQDYPLDEIRAACRASVIANPNRTPNEGHIVHEITLARREAALRYKAEAWKPSKPAAPPRDRVTKEQAEAILLAVGFSVKRMPQVSE
jgi:hypothetical protein